VCPQVGGFPLPFIVMGLITLGTSFLVCILMKQDVPSPNKAKSKLSREQNAVAPPIRYPRMDGLARGSPRPV